MPPEPAGGVARQVRRVAAALSASDVGDGALLTRFLADRDEEAFARLVRRHGPMVLGVCGRVAGHAQDAEDAFQAAFLVLARRASGLTGRATVGDWLYGVARRTALKARAAAARRRVKEAVVARPEAVAPVEVDELAGVIDREVARLPAACRAAVVLVELGGRPRREAAAELGIPEGTLSSRLSHARKLLAARLARRGFGPPAVLAAVVPTGLVDAAARTVRGGAVSPSVLTLAKHRSLAMTLTQWAAGLTAAALTAALCLGGGRDEPAADPPPPPPAADRIEEGVYLLRFEGDGKKVTFTEGYDGVLVRRLSAGVGTATELKSHSNDNTRFRLHVKGLGPLPPEVTEEQTALVVDGVVLHLSRPEKLPPGGIVDAAANVWSAEEARALAARYRIVPVLRKHPGHRVEARWTPDKASYRVGEAVTLKLALKNTGTIPLRFTFGGKQRGPRNNQFRFVAQEGQDGKALPDTGDPTNFGGLTAHQALERGATFRTDVDLSKWFTFSRPGTYRVTGILELPVIDPDSPQSFGPIVWDDLAVGECDVRVR